MGQRCFQKLQCVVAYEIQCKNNECLDLNLGMFRFWALVFLKGKVHPRTGHEGPEGEYRCTSNCSLTPVPDEVGGQCHAVAALPPVKTQYPLYRRMDGPKAQS